LQISEKRGSVNINARIACFLSLQDTKAVDIGPVSRAGAVVLTAGKIAGIQHCLKIKAFSNPLKV